MQHFVQPKPGCVGCQQHRAVLEIGRMRHEVLDLLATQDRGERLPLPRDGNRERRAVAFQRCVESAAHLPQRCTCSRTAVVHAAGEPDTLALPRRKCDPAAGDRIAPIPLQPRDTIRASARQTPVPPCHRPSVGVTRSSHTSVSRRAEHRSSVASIRAIVCVRANEERDSRIREDSYRDQRFRSTYE